MGVYLLSGKDLYREEESLRKILKDCGADRNHTVVFDASEAKTFRFDQAILECDTFSLFEGSDRKAVILRDPFFLNGTVTASKRSSKKKEDTEEAARQQRLSILEQYLKRPNPDTALVFYCHGFDADTRKKEYKLIEKYGASITSYKKMYDREFSIYVSDQLRKYGLTLTAPARNELLARVSCDTLLFHNAVEKLLLYGESSYGLDEIRSLVPLNPEVNIFNMSNQFVRGDLTGTLRSMDELLKASFDYTGMMSMLASRIRTMYNMRRLYEKGLSEEEIAVRLRQKPYAVKKGLENTSGIRSEKLLEYLCELAKMDQGIKAGRLNAKDEFERFILKSGNRYAGN